MAGCGLESTIVMAVPGLDPVIVPAIHVLQVARSKNVDARDKRGHDGQNYPTPSIFVK
jgi:hypothetical protein